MRAQHTPGPWHVVLNISGYPTQIRASFASEDKPGGIVDVTRWGAIGLPSSAEGQANARLIAAAPDMLAALEEALDAYADQFDGSPADDLNVNGAELVDWFSRWRLTARAAIAQARGK